MRDTKSKNNAPLPSLFCRTVRRRWVWLAMGTITGCWIWSTTNTSTTTTLQATFASRGTIPPRVFSIWHEVGGRQEGGWCEPTMAAPVRGSDDDDDVSRLSLKLSNHGLRFTKIPKCASSTGAAVSVRLARAMAARRATLAPSSSTLHCHYMVNHLKLSEGGFIPRDAQKSFLWTVVRRPDKRFLSHVFFKDISRRRKEPKPKVLMSLLRRKMEKDRNRQVNYARPYSSSTTTLDDVAQIFQEYDFVAVAERMEESLVVLSLLLHIRLWDVLVMDSKNSAKGGYDDGRSQQGCVRLVPSFTTKRMSRLLEREHARENYDYILHDLANASLNATIDALGQDLVQQRRDEFRTLHQYATAACQDSVRPPCHAETGQAQESNCYFSDWGCGYPCVDQLAEEDKQEHDKMP